MKDTFVFYHRDPRVCATDPAIRLEEVALKHIARTLFRPDRDGGAWLIFECKSGDGIGLIIGPFQPVRHADRKLKQKGAGVAAIPLHLAPVIADFGVSGLRWDGSRVVAKGQ
jgi:hypothetical protein